MQEIGRALEEPFTLAGLRRVLGRVHGLLHLLYLQREHRRFHEPLAEKLEPIHCR